MTTPSNADSGVHARGHSRSPPSPRGIANRIHYKQVPWNRLLVADRRSNRLKYGNEFDEIVSPALECMRAAGENSVLVCCQMGQSRSAALVLAFMCMARSSQARSVENLEAELQAASAQVVQSTLALVVLLKRFSRYLRDHAA